ncbi:branchpoint-bridging protein [Striga asiatica]|uniref:Branchpoint-bridging protein n=1 Tax=Striga asiatica TaxID=4170 RepID=A0A5A7PRA5_STRAF|nr:branchpoint-bridging protein [Striga asiatica]
MGQLPAETPRIPQLRNQFPHNPLQLVRVQIQNFQLLEVANSSRKPSREIIVRQIEIMQRPKINHLERRHYPESRDEPPGEPIPGEGQVLEELERDEGAELQVPGKGEAVEGDGDHGGGGVVADDAVEAAGAGGGVGGGYPGGEYPAGGVGFDALPELEE